MITQHDIGSAQKLNSPKYLVRAHQSRLRSDIPNENTNIAIFDNLDLRKSYVDIDGQRYPRDISTMSYEETDYIEQYKDLNIFFRDYIGELLLNPLRSYPDMKTKYSIGITDLRHHLDHITPKKFNFFKNMVLILTMLDCF